MSPRLEGLAIRSMSVHDLADVMGIERHSQNSASSDDNFKSEMRNGFTHAFVAHDEHRILGYLVFWLVHDEAYLLNLAVHTKISGDAVLDRGSWPFLLISLVITGRVDRFRSAKIKSLGSVPLGRIWFPTKKGAKIVLSGQA